jgi:uncharacterized coiled-coil protein SlyX
MSKTTSKKDELERICMTKLMTSESFFKNLTEKQREAIAQGRCTNLIKSETMRFTAKFYEMALEHGSMFVTARAITDEHVDFKLLKENINNIKNCKLIWRHFHPTNKKSDIHSPIYGYIREAWIEKEEEHESLIVRMEILGIFEYQKRLQIFVRQALNEGTPLGVSFRYYNFAGKFLHMEELGITPIPACDVCETLKIENVSDMANSEEIEKQLEAFQERMTTLEKSLESKDKEIETLNGSVEEKDANIKELEKEVKSLESKVSFLKTKKPKINKILEKVKEEEREDSSKILVDMTEEQLDWIDTKLTAIEENKFPQPTVVTENEIDPTEKADREKERLENLKELGYITGNEEE